MKLSRAVLAGWVLTTFGTFGVSNPRQTTVNHRAPSCAKCNVISTTPIRSSSTYLIAWIYGWPTMIGHYNRN